MLCNKKILGCLCFPVFFSLLILSSSALSFSSSEAGTKELTPEQTLKIRRIGELQLSPDERHIAMVVTEPVEGTARNSDIWVYDTESKHLIRFTTSEKRDSHPRWSPDSETLAFLSSRTEKTQIYLISLNGGEAEALTDSKTSIQSFEWSPDGKRIVYMSYEPKTEEEEKKQKDKDDARVVNLDDEPSRLWMLDMSTKEVIQLTKGEWRISSFCWTPDGKRLIVTATDQNFPELLADRLYALQISDGKLEEIARPAQPFGGIEISPDGRNIAYAGTRFDGPNAHDIYVMSIKGGKATNLTKTSIDRSVRSFVWLDNDNIILQAPKGFSNALYEIHIEGHAKMVKPFSVPVSGSFTKAKDFLAFVAQTATQTPELWVSKNPGEAEKVSRFNAEWDAVPVMALETVTYPSFDGKMIEAGLLKPKDYKDNGRIPLIVLVHGGPAGRWSDSFHSWGQLLAQHGFAVLYPNIRGSIGYGHDFVTANRSDWGGGDYKDVMAGVDYLIDEGIADPDRLGIGGWSYGGYMAGLGSDPDGSLQGCGLRGANDGFGQRVWHRASAHQRLRHLVFGKSLRESGVVPGKISCDIRQKRQNPNLSPHGRK